MGSNNPSPSPSLSVLLFLIIPFLVGVGGTTSPFSVDEFGAVGNGRADDTQAFLDAWNVSCSSPTRTVLEIPAGKVYLVRPVNFVGPCNAKLKLVIRGTIVAPSDPGIWDKLDPEKWIYFLGVNWMVVEGGGTINGMGQEWWAQSCKRNKTNPCRSAPMAISFYQCKHLTMRNLTVTNSQKMHIAFFSSSHIRASHMTVIAPADSPNTDGIHLNESVSVVVKDSTIRTGDDCISIVANSSDIRIRRIVCGPGHGISIGSLGKAQAYDQVHNIRVDECLITNTQNGVRIKSWQGGSGYARKIVFQNIWMKNVSNPIIIDQYYCDSTTPCENQTMAVKMDDISFISINGTSATKDAIRFACSDSFPCEKLFLKDIYLSLESGGPVAAYCWKATGHSSGLVYPLSCLSSAGDHGKQYYGSR
ncbi:probable polygalacturonase At1g80170 isoform X1 [Typha latifolia]|uniref:probable polygalacturonase At1g80170 isoform X1 n=1 Tax=Typha latifolia TaxID=4733 RepID=UPI003C2CBB99